MKNKNNKLSQFLNDHQNKFGKIFEIEMDLETNSSTKKTIKVVAPEMWSVNAVKIAATKYLRTSGLPAHQQENSVYQLVHRVVHAIIKQAKLKKILMSVFELKQFQYQLENLMINQAAAFNSPVWFNVGLFESYGMKASSEHFAWNEKNKKIEKVKNIYARPQCSACFIQSVDDQVESIFRLAANEARLFKYGSGSGSNFSRIRSRFEDIQSGGKSSGLISFLDVLDRGAGAIKSGGVSRRAAKMVIVDVDHPEIEDFIDWKMKEEKKAQVLIQAGYSSDIDGEAYRSVSGQNANLSVRVSDQFMKAVVNDGWICLKQRQNRKTFKKIKARELFERIAVAAWTCADPGIQFHDEINRWHTCSKTSQILASNPCSEYMFIDESACNLASINLIKMFDEHIGFDFDLFKQTIETLLFSQELLVDYASYPTQSIAENSHSYRPLGLGYANLGALMMRMGFSYDSEHARAYAAAITSLMMAFAVQTSAKMAKMFGPYKQFRKNRVSHLQVLKNHQKALKNVAWHLLPKEIESLTKSNWHLALQLADQFGQRNAQLTLIAPTGTIGLFMDCDTTGIEPEFQLNKNKKLHGGGQLELQNQSVISALNSLKIPSEKISEIMSYLDKNQNLTTCPLLTEQQQLVFSCAVGPKALSPLAHLKMMATVQPFLSGAISKTVNLPSTATVDDVKQVYLQAWKMKLKSVALYRDGSKFSQPLNPIKVNGEEIKNSNVICLDCG